MNTSWTPLHAAIYSNKVLIVLYLLEQRLENPAMAYCLPESFTNPELKGDIYMLLLTISRKNAEMF
jgi:ankyrin repeat protein